MSGRENEEFEYRSAAYEASEDVGSNPVVEAGRATLGDVINSRYSRRGLIKGMLGTAAIAGLATALPGIKEAEAASKKSSFPFSEIQHGVDLDHHVADGYDADVLLRWGDPLTADAPDFDPYNQTADAQSKQFGYNNDFVGFLPLEAADGQEERGLLCVNHEYTVEEVMFPGIGRQDASIEKGGKAFFNMTPELTAVEQAAHGCSVVEVAKTGGKWAYVKGSKYNRRITTNGTQMLLTGPAAGSDRLKTGWDATGTRVIGTVNNCAGGMTPWGTYLTAEENFHGYFMGTLPEGHKEAENYKRYGVGGGWYGWGLYDARFDVSKEPNEANRFGWIVEIDPLDPYSIPKKRTALGRVKHEGGEPVINGDNRIVVYMGDDERFDYVYKFVTAGKYDAANAEANKDLLDDGVLYVAKFNEDGSVEWMALQHGNGPLTEANGFASQADVLIETRRAADLIGATPMDRPEDVQANPATGKVYVMLTNNTKRKDDQVNGANPRANNEFGHIVEIVEPNGDFASTKSTWEVLVQCGDPKDGKVGAMWNPATTENGWFAAPDNCAVDHQGRLWVTTDQGSAWSKSGTADGVFALETEGKLRGTSKMFYRVPLGAEMCGPCFTPADTSLFVAVQHVGTDGVKAYKPFGRNSTFEDPATRWPDFDDKMPPRPSVVAITKKGGGVIGS